MVSGVDRVTELKVSLVDPDSGGPRPRPVKGRRVGSSYSFSAHGTDENCALMSESGSSSKRR